MGERLKQDMALSPEIVVAVLRRTIGNGLRRLLRTTCRQWARLQRGACFYVLTYAAGLRGLRSRRWFYRFGSTHPVPTIRAYLALPLTGHFKARGRGIVNILMFLVQTTDSGVETGLWLRRLLSVRDWQGRLDSWLFVDEQGVQAKTGHFSEGFYRKLEEVLDERPDLFVPGVEMARALGLFDQGGGEQRPGPQRC
jgi:hypothetical protein